MLTWTQLACPAPTPTRPPLPQLLVGAGVLGLDGVLTHNNHLQPGILTDNQVRMPVRGLCGEEVTPVVTDISAPEGSCLLSARLAATQE